MPRQLSFDLPARPALDREDFFVSPANALAVELIERPDTWTAPQLVLTGPAGAGKTHLAHVWAARTGAAIVAARALPEHDIAALASGPVAVEDVPDIAGAPEALKALFHLYNLMRAEGQPLLLTGRGSPMHWNLSLADIQSRVAAALRVDLAAPDDRLLSAVLAKLFADRQITPRPEVIPYLIRHMERSFAAAQAIVARLDKASLEEGRTLSRALAARLLSAPL